MPLPRARGKNRITRTAITSPASIGARKTRGTEAANRCPVTSDAENRCRCGSRPPPSPEAMPIKTASSRKNCSSRRLKRCGDSIVAQAAPVLPPRGGGDRRLDPATSFGLGTMGSWGIISPVHSHAAPASAALDQSIHVGTHRRSRTLHLETYCMVGSIASGFFRKAFRGRGFFCNPLVYSH